MAFIGTNFMYNGISNRDMGVILIRSGNSSAVKQQFLVNSDLLTEKIKNNDIPYVYGVNRKVRTLQITIAKIDDNGDIAPLTYNDRVALVNWLCPDDNFHEFISEDFPEIIYYVYFNEGEFTNVNSNQGYITLTGIMNAPYAFSPISYQQWDLSTNTTSKIIEVENKSNVLYYYTPNVVEFTLVGNNRNFKLVNRTNGNKVFEFTELDESETICVNSNLQILSSTKKERISKFNLGFEALELVRGVNRLEIYGKCIFKIRQQFPMAV